MKGNSFHDLRELAPSHWAYPASLRSPAASASVRSAASASLAVKTKPFRLKAGAQHEIQSVCCRRQTDDSSPRRPLTGGEVRPTRFAVGKELPWFRKCRFQQVIVAQPFRPAILREHHFVQHEALLPREPVRFLHLASSRNALR